MAPMVTAWAVPIATALVKVKLPVALAFSSSRGAHEREQHPVEFVQHASASIISSRRFRSRSNRNGRPLILVHAAIMCFT